MRQSHKRGMLPFVVDSFPIDESVYGARGLTGNMSDWTGSIWSEGWAEIALDSGKLLPRDIRSDIGSLRVYRSGSWCSYERGLRVSRRSDNDPMNRSNSLGFRLGLGG